MEPNNPEGLGLPEALLGNGRDEDGPPRKRRKLDVAPISDIKSEESEVPEIKQEPGLEAVKNFKFVGKRFILTYKGHLDAEIIYAKLKKEFKNDKLTLRVWWERSSGETPYDHTHVLVDLHKKANFRVRKVRGKSYDTRKNSRFLDLGGIHPNFKKISSIKHWKNALEYDDKGDSTIPDAVKMDTLDYEVKSKQGQRGDIESYRKMVMEQDTWRQVLMLNEEWILKHLHVARQWFDHRKVVEFKIDNMRQWQHTVDKFVDEEPDDRTIWWIEDLAGDAGKSMLSKHLVLNKGALLYTGGKWDTYRYLLDHNKIMVFDLVRATDREMVPYALMEEFKNGLTVSSKYRPVTKVYKPPHVIVFANMSPDYSKLSLNRWKHSKLMKDDQGEWHLNEVDVRATVNAIVGGVPAMFNPANNFGAR